MTYPYRYPMVVKKKNPEWRKQRAWMFATFGRPCNTYWAEGRWIANDGHYCFKDEQDAVLFALRWS